METFRFQLLRYVPDTIKDEFINILRIFKTKGIINPRDTQRN